MLAPRFWLVSEPSIKMYDAGRASALRIEHRQLEHRQIANKMPNLCHLLLAAATLAGTHAWKTCT